MMLEPVVPRLLALPRHRAIIVGNNKYSGEGFPPLSQCVHDAEDMTVFFSTRGYAVTMLLDASKAAIEDAMCRFAATLEPGCVVLLYFSGHGLSSGGRNFLVPVDGMESGMGATGLGKPKSFSAILGVPHAPKSVNTGVEFLWTDNAQQHSHVDWLLGARTQPWE